MPSSAEQPSVPLTLGLAPVKLRLEYWYAPVATPGGTREDSMAHWYEDTEGYALCAGCAEELVADGQLVWSDLTAIDPCLPVDSTVYCAYCRNTIVEAE